jgi:hypothetical protein
MTSPKNNEETNQTNQTAIIIKCSISSRVGQGQSSAYFPIYHYLFVNYSQPFSQKIADMNVELYGKTDLRFIECMYKVGSMALQMRLKEEFVQPQSLFWLCTYTVFCPCWSAPTTTHMIDFDHEIMENEKK